MVFSVAASGVHFDFSQAICLNWAFSPWHLCSSSRRCLFVCVLVGMFLHVPSSILIIIIPVVQSTIHLEKFIIYLGALEGMLLMILCYSCNSINNPLRKIHHIPWWNIIFMQVYYFQSHCYRMFYCNMQINLSGAPLSLPLFMTTIVTKLAIITMIKRYKRNEIWI